MTIALTTPVTGTAQTGLTSPTYTVVADTPPNAYSKQYAVTALAVLRLGWMCMEHRSLSPLRFHARLLSDRRQT
jgi:hypothetical protein